VAFRRDKNLCDTLVHSKTNRIVKANNMVCFRDCSLCSILEMSGIKDTNEQSVYKVSANINCRERNVIYAIKCNKCNKAVYVGETEREIRDRMKEHLSDVRLDREKPINRHFGIRGHSSNDVRFVILRRMFNAGKIERQIHETDWI